jgi:WD40 repeat protein
MRTIQTYSGTIYDISFSPDGSKMLVGCAQEIAKIIDVITGVCLVDLEGHTGYVLSGIFTSDGAIAMTACSHGIVMVSDVQTGVVIKTTPLYDECQPKSNVLTGWELPCIVPLSYSFMGHALQQIDWHLGGSSKPDRMDEVVEERLPSGVWISRGPS